MEENNQTSVASLTVPTVEGIQEPVKNKGGRPKGPPKPETRAYTVNPILTQDAFKVPREQYLEACKVDKTIARHMKSLERRKKIMREGKAKLTKKRSDYCNAQVRLINIILGKIY